jgi:hypothetical protein
MITLGGRQFSGPFLAPLWSPPRAPGLYAVLVPGWRLLIFHPLYFGHSGDLSSPEVFAANPRYGDWLTVAGTRWNLYIATCEMYLSTEGERVSAHRDLLKVPTIATTGQVDAQL